jgi:alginate lyase/fibronectin type III domain protein
MRTRLRRSIAPVVIFLPLSPVGNACGQGGFGGFSAAGGGGSSGGGGSGSAFADSGGGSGAGSTGDGAVPDSTAGTAAGGGGGSSIDASSDSTTPGVGGSGRSGDAGPVGHFGMHPGGLHTLADLERMKTQVAAGAHPWIDDWKVLIADPQAQNTYTASPVADMGANRQRADADAHAAYLNTIRWYISGDTTYADTAVRICNAWSSTVNNVPSNTGLVGLPIMSFGLVGELLRIYSGWNATDFARFKNMMGTYLYPSAHDFITNHLGTCISYLTTSWDGPNMAAVLATGVLLDDQAKFDEAVNYYESGPGNGAIAHAVWMLQPGNIGQASESGRDQEHATLGIADLGVMAQVAWNQGVDLFGYDNSRLLAGAEYLAQYNLWHSVTFSPFNDCVNDHEYYISINGHGRLDDRPVYALFYNHYGVLEGMSAPNTQAMAQLMSPEHGSADHFGYGTLTFTLSASAYPPLPIPAVPTGLTTVPGASAVYLTWTPPGGDTAQGYVVRRATTSGGPYATIASWNASTAAEYTDATAVDGTTYYYVVSAVNQAGTSANSAPASATPVAAGALPAGWQRADVASAGGAGSYAGVVNGTFLVNGNGTGIGGASDSFSYAYRNVTGDHAITARLLVAGTKVGLMMRETLAANSALTVITLGDVGGRETKWGVRASAGANVNWTSGNEFTVVPVWYKLVRAGNTFTAFQSLDGVTWFTVGSSTVAMAGTYFVGLAVVSGATTFDSVTAM